MDTRTPFPQPEQLPAAPLSPAQRREVVLAANAWLSQFTPLLDDLDQLSADECRGRLKQVPALRADGDRVLLRLQEHACQSDAGLLATLREAVRELAGQENDLRQRLALLEPGDPQGMVDLSELRERLAEAAARREVASVTGSLGGHSTLLELQTSPPNWGAALMMGVFSFGWMSFTTVHAVLMIGGMFHAFGWIALALLGFYALFWSVGIAMAWGAILSASQEHLAGSSGQLTITRKFLRWSWSKKYRVSSESRAYVKRATSRHNSGANSSLQAAFTDSEGREITFASGRPEPELDRLIARLSDYLRTVRG
jgi:hypothetical protein